jgi:hypothetical protein
MSGRERLTNQTFALLKLLGAKPLAKWNQSADRKRQYYPAHVEFSRVSHES